MLRRRSRGRWGGVWRKVRMVRGVEAGTGEGGGDVECSSDEDVEAEFVGVNWWVGWSGSIWMSPILPPRRLAIVSTLAVRSSWSRTLSNMANVLSEMRCRGSPRNSLARFWMSLSVRRKGLGRRVDACGIP